ncbi:6-phosphogluconate dehydrogenase, decarboxylating [Winogradskyella psychrotolerans RS-3]|uniref:6-phosphogluconate dehydrogenase, decarboxylating n=1 Tax=Winogradskyella psychrotolerans RS-3 TaxID=641526 RepID=S7VKI7_9FLAO|nr:NADP-dependent phosphogluconate dehydrogenase [Winogradskyella psychrotolerans]EPR70037.1 6-phosphogluconate dehydrogenase, decarboxylating [Winogradskyella psychrotolerans RS-3]
MKQVIFVIGVSGCGKSTIGKLLAEELDLPFFDGDDFHPKANIKKMSSGLPLNDDDRQGWLKTLNDLAKKQLTKNSCVIVCSALKEKYRDILSLDIEAETKWVYLRGDFNQIYNRVNRRRNHFMPSELLKSQFDTLEEPKDAIQIDISLTPESIIKTLKHKLMDKSEFGLFGLGVMGKSLCRNLANNGFKIAMFNRHVDGVEVDIAKDFKAKFPELSQSEAFDDIAAFVNALQQPRRIMLMVNAGKTIDYVIEDLLPHLSENDILIDGGNSNYVNTKERVDYLKTKGIHFIGAGVSGGEEGALKGPSIMPSGDLKAYKSVQPFLEKIAAKDKNGLPCCTYVGPEGSGHFIKMVHNGVEYVEMQLLAEVATILEALGQIPDDIANTFETWKSTANSYLLEITADIFRKKEGDDWLVNKILDKAGNKGTGNWTTMASAELGVPSTLIASALFSRYISFYKEERVQLNQNFEHSRTSELNLTTNDILEAYQFARIINHYQGFKLISEASNTFSWDLNLSEIARIWTNGCIIRSALMEDLVDIFKDTTNILTNSKLIDLVNQYRPSVKKVVSQCVLNDITTPALGEAIQFLNGITTSYASANIIQAQRDYFGAHTYQRLDDDSGKNHHTNWN